MVSVFRIAKSKNDYVEYIMHIRTEGKKSKKKARRRARVSLV